MDIGMMSPADKWRPLDAWLFAGATFLYSILFGVASFGLSLQFPALLALLHQPSVNVPLFLFNLGVMAALSLMFAKRTNVGGVSFRI